jgi:uncharacterized BrkB/YihY/UPF0761 family membrane protein
MSELFVRYGIVYILLAAFLTARPWLSRKNVLFGVVFGSAEIWEQESSRKVIRRFVLACLAIGIVLAAAFLAICNGTSPDEIRLTQLYVSTVFALIVLGMIPYILANRGMKKLKAMLSDENLVKGRITVEVGDADRNRPVSAS